MKKWFSFDIWLLLPAFFLSLLSILLLATLSQEHYLALYQGIFLVLGLVIFCLFSRLYYQVLFGFWPYLYGIGLFLLLLVLVLGETKFGSSRWINLGFFNLQPSEVFKVILVIALAGYLREREELTLKEFLGYLVLLFVPIILVAKEPDLGTAVVYLVMGLLLYFFWGKSRRYLHFFLAVLLISAPLIFQFGLKPYQRERLLTFLNPRQDLLGSGYNVWQSMIAIGSGGLWGKGLGRGTQSQLQFLPIRYADFIFATAAEALGFAGSAVIIVLYALLIYRMIWVSYQAEEKGAYLAGLSFACIFLFQILVNIGMNLGIMPITGLPLVFLSYGGSSLLTSYIILGIVSNIYRRGRKLEFA